MKLKVGIMGSAGDTMPEEVARELRETAVALGRACAQQDVIVLTGATTGLPALVGGAAREAGALHIGISPAASEREHAEQFKYPLDNCDALIYTGFGLKGRNVVLVRSCDVVLIIAGAMGTLNEFTIAHDEGRVIGCLTGTGGVADEAARLMGTFPKRTGARLFESDHPERLLEMCLEELRTRNNDEV